MENGQRLAGTSIRVCTSRVEVEVSAVDQQADRSRGQRLRDTSDAEPSGDGYVHLVFEARVTEPLGPDQSAVLSHGNTHPGYTLPRHPLANSTSRGLESGIGE